ncbi:uncharacterized protein LOC129219370 [Uloborus diversus]|uniref:uncharacterized protein LOC129219370 n=1 Tax=Uloborus diversus TaxID=327109 RepID=UPI002409CEDB|nr:uncharacterized protein LOC129219370 [Uloborus diversus]
MPATYAIVNFTQTNEVEVVPVTWLSENGCVWPPFKTTDVQKMVKKLIKPSKGWICHEARVLGQYSTYDTARKYLNKAEEDTDLSSEKELGKGKRKKFPQRLSTSSSEEESLSFTETTGIRIPEFNANLIRSVPNACRVTPEAGKSVDDSTQCSVTLESCGNNAEVMSVLLNLTKQWQRFRRTKS